MNDHVRFGPSDARADAALRDAFSRKHRDDQPATDADPGRHRAGRRSHLLVAGAAFVAVMVAGGVATGLGPRADDATGSIPPLLAVPAAADGWRWDSYYGVRVQVPSHWAYELEPARDRCIGGRPLLPRHPYVSLGASGQSVAGVDCRDANGHLTRQPPTSLWAPHVALDLATDVARARTTRTNGWWVVRRPVGDVVVTAVSHDRTIADRIAASAEIIDR